MDGYLLDAGTFLLRWLHVVAAIAWIGESFYFVALDRGLKPPATAAPGLAGESWSVHGGGFYRKQKYLPAPPQLPDELHWSKWKSYTTWLSGFALLCALYFSAPGIYLLDPAVAALTPAQGVGAAIALLLVGWIGYDLLCRAVGFRDGVLGVLVALLVSALALVATQLFAGRAAFLLTGAVLATIMSANVLFVIIPGQKRMVAALARGATPEPLPGLRGRQRSVHNTYFTLPVVFAMLSTHYAPAYAHPYNGAVLLLFMLAAALIRQFFVVWHGGERAWGLLAAVVVVLLATLAWLAPPAKSPDAIAPATAGAVTEPAVTLDVQSILQRHCTACHSAAPKLVPSAPKGIALDRLTDAELHAAAIRQQVVVLRIMPPGNMTGMQPAERDAIARWSRAAAASD